MATDEEPIRIVTSKCGRFKYAECSAGYGSSATLSFIKYRTPLLAHEIESARTVWVRTWKVSGTPPGAAQIMQEFRQIGELCVDEDIGKYVANPTQRTPLRAASEIIHGFFPAYSLTSIERMGRALKRPAQKNRTKL